MFLLCKEAEKIKYAYWMGDIIKLILIPSQQKKNSKYEGALDSIANAFICRIYPLYPHISNLIPYFPDLIIDRARIEDKSHICCT